VQFRAVYAVKSWAPWRAVPGAGRTRRVLGWCGRAVRRGRGVGGAATGI